MDTTDELNWLRSGFSCLPCRYGVHADCRGYPQGRSSRLREDETRPCGCAEHGHPVATTCRARLQADSFSYEPPFCDKPAKGTRPADWSGVCRPDVPVCGVHLAAYRRVEENDRRRRQVAKDREARYQREGETRQASLEWAQRLQEEFGLAAEPERTGKTAVGLRVLLDPEALYGLLVHVEGALRDAGTSWVEAVRDP